MPQAPFGIKTSSYEEERHLFEMWRWINLQLKLMEITPGFDEAYHLQYGKNVKKLKEEAIPIASFALRFVNQMNQVYIRCLAGNQPYDAELRVEGFCPLKIKVEVTTTQTEETVFARQQLAEKGFVHRPARFEETKGGRVSLPPEMVDMAEQYDEWIGVALERAEKKVSSGRYDKLTAVLVCLDVWSPLPLSFRAKLVDATRNRLGSQLGHVYGVYYLHGRNIDEVRDRSGGVRS